MNHIVVSPMMEKLQEMTVEFVGCGKKVSVPFYATKIKDNYTHCSDNSHNLFVCLTSKVVSS